MIQDKRSCVVVGAGFSGLSLAYWAVKAGLNVRLVERSQRVGGLLSSRRVSGHLVESAANGFLWSDDLAELERDLGEPFIPTLPGARRRFIYRGGKFRRWPLGPLETLRMGVFFLGNWSRRAPKALETISDWGHRMLGPAAEKFLLSTALQGIYAGDPSRLSASLILGRFFGSGRSASPGHVRSGRRGSHSHPEGMEGLCRAMLGYLERTANFKWVRGQEFEERDLRAALDAGTRVFLAVPPSDAAKLVTDLDPAASRALGSLEMSPVATATLVFDRDPEDGGLPAGFGILYPRGEGIDALGTLRNHHIFEGRSDAVSETWIFAGARLKEKGLWRDASGLEKLILAERSRLSHRDLAPRLFECYFWENGIPHYTVDLERTLASGVLERLAVEKNVDVFGNFTGALGLGRIFGAARELVGKRMRIDV